ncbi:MAG TPA: YjbE family putative metal transport protein [Ktedonobacteraceae bacterium]|nr:YjbE family putative metal transport protein [Ktedonobacteraceae bacterium]
MFELLGAVVGILLVDLVLSGDNALVIGAAAVGLSRRQRWLVLLLGGSGAIVLRLVFAILATLLLRLPFIQAIGGLLLLLIAIRLLAAREEKWPEKSRLGVQAQTVGTVEHAGTTNKLTPPSPRSHNKSLVASLLTILVADVTMSLDNVLAVGALAHGNLPLLLAGLALSVLILMIGSALVAELIGRLPWLLDVAALVLAWTGASMVLSDLSLGPWLNQYPWTQLVVPALAFAIVLMADVVLRMREGETGQPG